MYIYSSPALLKSRQLRLNLSPFCLCAFPGNRGPFSLSFRLCSCPLVSLARPIRLQPSIIATAVQEPVHSTPTPSAYTVFRSLRRRHTLATAGITNHVHRPQPLSRASPSGTSLELYPHLRTLELSRGRPLRLTAPQLKKYMLSRKY